MISNTDLDSLTAKLAIILAKKWDRASVKVLDKGVLADSWAWAKVEIEHWDFEHGDLTNILYTKVVHFNDTDIEKQLSNLVGDCNFALGERLLGRVTTFLPESFQAINRYQEQGAMTALVRHKHLVAQAHARYGVWIFLQNGQQIALPGLLGAERLAEHIKKIWGI